MMAKCKYCNKVMLKSDGCDCELLTMNDGETYRRIAVGEEFDFYYGMDDEELKCHDCNALYGHYHHEGCDCEICPVCHEQLISCEC